MNHLDRAAIDRQGRMARKSAVIFGGVATIIAAALIWVAASDAQDSPTALALEDATQATTTTTELSTTSTTAAPVESTTTNVARSNDVDWVTAWGGAPPTTISDATAANASTTTTTVAPVAATGPAAVSIPRPNCANNVGAPTTRTAPFTGLSASIPSNMPAVVVKVSNNNSSSRASLIGLDEADIVIEERIEASATRFFAVFHSETPPNVGPVRSGRTTDLQLAQNLNRPVFGYSGSNDGVARQFSAAADGGLFVPFVNTDRAPFARDGRYRAPDNLFVDPAALGGCGGGGNPTAIFSYGANTSTSAQAASSVSLSARSPYRFDWDGSSWVRSQDGTTHATRTGAVLAPENVVVLFVPYVQSEVDAQSVDALTIGSGAAWVFRDGTATIGNYRRSGGTDPYTLTDANGSAVNLAPGQTWVVLAPAGTANWN